MNPEQWKSKVFLIEVGGHKAGNPKVSGQFGKAGQVFVSVIGVSSLGRQSGPFRWTAEMRKFIVRKWNAEDIS